MSLIAELQRRNVIRVGIAWLALSWLLVAIANLLFPAMDLPISAVRWLLLGLLGALPFVLLVAWRYQMSSRGLRVDRGEGAEDPASRRTSRRIDQASVVLVLGAVSLSILFQVLAPYAAKREAARTTAQAEPAAPAPFALPPGPVDPRSIAVLPFANMSPDPEDAYFADGLAEELLNVLARIADLKVTSRSSSFAFRNAPAGATEIAARLGVAHLLQGSVRRQGDQVRITAQLVNAVDGRQLWSETYDRQLKDIFRVQQEIAQSIADTLVDSLGVRSVKVAPVTTDLQAYEAYLRGRQLFIQRGANLPAARELLERAIERDPNFSDAWATLAGVWYVWRSYAPDPQGIDSLQRASEAATKALKLQPDQPAALAVSARLAAIAGDRLREDGLITKARQLEPNNANTWLWQGLGQIETGHVEQAHASFANAERLDPLSGLQQGWLGISTTLRSDRVGGELRLQQAHTLGWRGPASRALFLISLGASDAPAIVQRRYLDWLHDDDAMPAEQREFARTLAAAWVDPAQKKIVQQALTKAVAEQPNLDWTLLLVSFGMTDAAMDALLRADPVTSQPIELSLWFDAFAALRAHPRFLEWAEQRGMLRYWQKFGSPDGCQLLETPERHLDCARAGK